MALIFFKFFFFFLCGEVRFKSNEKIMINNDDFRNRYFKKIEVYVGLDRI